MLYGDIITKSLIEVFGSDTPQSEITSNIYGSEGIVSKIQRQIQEDHNFWFMESLATEALVDGISVYDIDYEFKSEIDDRSLRIKNENDFYYPPLVKMTTEEFESIQSSEGTPTRYYIDFNASTGYRRLNLYPKLSITAPATRTLYMRYWGYLNRLSNVDVTLNTTEDMLSKEAPYLLIYQIAMAICGTIENYDTNKYNSLNINASNEYKLLLKKDWQYKIKKGRMPHKKI